MKIDIITTAVGGWNRYVKPMVDSILKHEHNKEVGIIVVDAGNNFPKEYKGITIIKTPLLNCSEAQNVGIEYSNADVFLVSDCDVICKKPFYKKWFKNYPEHVIGGNKVHRKDSCGFITPSKWLDGWIYSISREVYNTIKINDDDLFDPNFQGSGFEDADLCFRAVEAGYEIGLMYFPFKHLAANVKKDISKEYNKVRQANIEYLRKKWNLRE